MKTTKTIKLKFPFSIAGQSVDSLEMRRPQTLDVLASLETSAHDITQDANLFANLCMVTPETIDELDAVDLAKLTEAFNKFSEFKPINDYSPGTPIPLAVPVKGEGMEIKEIKMRRPKTKDLREAQAATPSAARQDCILYAALTGLTLDQINALDWSDMRKIKDIYSGFLA